MFDRKLKRREFLKASALGVLGAAAACAAPTELAVEAPTQTPVVVTEIQTQVVVEEKKVVETVIVKEGFKEAPMLKAKVDAGTLPPVDERLPETPLVVGGREAIGVYGGEARVMIFDTVWFISAYDLNAERMLHYSDIDQRTIVPNILEGWEVTPDGKEYTFRLRKGMKWSDATPLTTEDVKYWWEVQCQDPDIGWGVSWQHRFGGENMKVDYVDDYTFKFTFARSFGNYPAHLTRWHAYGDIIWPAHYYKQFHPKFADLATLDANAKAAGFEDWKGLYGQKQQWGATIWQAPPNWKECPSLSPWLIMENPEEGIYLWERNPYYWKVDLLGNQLPYLDTKKYKYVQTIESRKLATAQSEMDIFGQHEVTIADYPFYKENEAKSNYTVGDYISCMSDREVLFPQHVLTEDPVLTTIAQDPRWVQALSLAIDRSEVNESLLFGLARVGGMAPVPSSKYYKPAYGEAWAKYDPDTANKLLDEMGLDKRDSEGFRLRPDGARLSYQIEHAGQRVGPLTEKYAEMVTTYWREIGIEATAKTIEENLYGERIQAGLLHCGIWHADRCTDMLLHIEWQWFIPTGGGGQGGASNLWANWYNAADKTAEGLVEPPDAIKQLYEWHDKVAEVVSEDERVQYGQKIFDWLAENPLEIGLILECPAPLLFNKNFRNLPRPKAVIGWDSYGLSTFHPEAFFYEGGVRA